MYKLTFKKRVWIVKQYLKGVSAADLAMGLRIHRRCVYQLVEKYNQYGWEGLQDSKTGRPETTLSANAVTIILDLRRRYAYGAVRIEQLLKSKGFGISHRQIEKVLIRHDCVVPNPKKQKRRSWVRYELPCPNDLWHTDWTNDPFTGKQFSVFIDDRTRLITSYGVFKRASTKNTLALLREGIAAFGKPKAVMTDHGSQYYANKSTPEKQRTEFRKTLNMLSIKHCLAPVNRPQTNGKVERFFLTYKTEYLTSTFNNINEFITHYNNARPHMSLHYRTPTEAWKELVTV